MEFKYIADNQIGTYYLKGNLIGEKDGISITESFSNELEDGMRNFIVDLNELIHINSSGLGVLITLLTKARKAGGELILSNPSSYIQNLLLITKLDTIFQIFPSLEESKEFYRQASS
ncbi:MAG: anti-sigma factor antagonist [Bacteroidetes bacterium]|nr:MAG: anti-sigma factor antagonist [Bacteroidota bacterium]